MVKIDDKTGYVLGRGYLENSQVATVTPCIAFSSPEMLTRGFKTTIYTRNSDVSVATSIFYTVYGSMVPNKPVCSSSAA